MTTIAEFSIPAEQFALRETLSRRPHLKFEIDRVVAHDTARVMPFVWVLGEGLEDLTAILDADPSVKQVELLTETDEERFYRLEWADEARIIGHMVIECGATVQRAIAAADEWTLRVLFPERSGVSAIHDFARKHGLDLDVDRLYNVDTARRVRFGLTESQHDTIVEAYKRGYYTIPRETDAVELAAELDISHQAVGERLRRATANIIENTLLVDKDGV
ncbi:bacterio-opsin activator domain-containing protein [Haladaptatus halobius]|uniref:bacterio-opsin activator domain-containing protein n=1 Tax=Haladaptatus halobius TaxID=2884875 RepID=UPI001D09FB4A|nr:bacterio-opsin activator domain-containing protein [Haladaptatus halobius]